MDISDNNYAIPEMQHKKRNLFLLADPATLEETRTHAAAQRDILRTEHTALTTTSTPGHPQSSARAIDIFRTRLANRGIRPVQRYTMKGNMRWQGVDNSSTEYDTVRNDRLALARSVHTFRWWLLFSIPVAGRHLAVAIVARQQHLKPHLIPFALGSFIQRVTGSRNREFMCITPGFNRTPQGRDAGRRTCAEQAQ